MLAEKRHFVADGPPDVQPLDKSLRTGTSLRKVVSLRYVRTNNISTLGRIYDFDFCENRLHFNLDEDMSHFNNG